jgi:hypothetical protein
MARRKRQRFLGRLSSSVGLDFIDSWGLRNTSFQLLDTNNQAVAIVDIVDGGVIRFLAIPMLIQYRDAIVRLAMSQLRKSVPASFSKVR